jgi:hypothetical protein
VYEQQPSHLCVLAGPAFDDDNVDARRWGAMRLRSLDLVRYGKFTNRTIDFGLKPEFGPDPHIVESSVLKDRSELEGKLRQGLLKLRRIATQVLSVRQHMRDQVAKAFDAKLQADADLPPSVDNLKLGLPAVDTDHFDMAAKALLPEKLVIDTPTETVQRFREAWRRRRKTCHLQ